MATPGGNQGYGAPGPWGSPVYGPGPWGPPPPGYGYRPYAPRPNNFAVASLACSVASVLVGFTCIFGIVFGHIALYQIRRTGEGGRGLAVAGLIVGYVFLLVGIVALVVVISLASQAHNPSSSTLGVVPG